MPQQPHAPVSDWLARASLAKVFPSSRDFATNTARPASPCLLSGALPCHATNTLPLSSAATEPPPSKPPVHDITLRSGSNAPLLRRVYSISLPLALFHAT